MLATDKHPFECDISNIVIRHLKMLTCGIHLHTFIVHGMFHSCSKHLQVSTAFMSVVGSWLNNACPVYKVTHLVA